MPPPPPPPSHSPFQTHTSSGIAPGSPSPPPSTRILTQRPPISPSSPPLSGRHPCSTGGTPSAIRGGGLWIWPSCLLDCHTTHITPSVTRHRHTLAYTRRSSAHLPRVIASAIIWWHADASGPQPTHTRVSTSSEIWRILCCITQTDIKIYVKYL